jgi:hypothetical protein
MAYGDPFFAWQFSGSTALTNASQSLWGNFDGLSTLDNKDVVVISINTLNNSTIRVAPSSLSNDNGIRISPASMLVDLRPMLINDASMLRVYTDVASANGSAMFNIWVQNR